MIVEQEKLDKLNKTSVMIFKADDSDGVSSTVRPKMVRLGDLVSEIIKVLENKDY